jgi:hypothetical protein
MPLLYLLGCCEAPPDLVRPALVWSALLLPAILMQAIVLAWLPADQRRSQLGVASLVVGVVSVVGALLTLVGVLWLHAVQDRYGPHLTPSALTVLRQAEAQTSFLIVYLPILAVGVLTLSLVTAEAVVIASRGARRQAQRAPSP